MQRSSGTAYIDSDIFDEFTYSPENAPPVPKPSQHISQNSEDGTDNTAFEIPLSTVMECLNIFGTAGASNSNSNSQNKVRRWRKIGEASDDEHGNTNRGSGRQRAARNSHPEEKEKESTIDQYFGKDKGAGMRIS